VQKERVEKVRGPAKKVAFDEEGKPTKAAYGFARSQGVEISDLVVEEVNGGLYVFAVKKIEGGPVKELLAERIPEIITRLSFKKSMRWGSGSFRFVRPVRWVLALMGTELLEFELAGIKSGNISKGHRFLGEKEVIIEDSEKYEELLSDKGKVIVDEDKRREEILRMAAEASSKVGGIPVLDEAVLEEVVHLVEYPNASVGSFDEKYLKLPDEVLITVMQHHQRYFPVRSHDGKLLNHFVVIHNGSPLYEENIREGNERVVRARFEDAQFFFEEDLKKPLDTLVEGLKGVVFQKKLGSLYEKTLRNIELSSHISELLSFGKNEIELVRRAARLLKADLLTDMVNEFDELQGIMGREYALRQGEEEAVSTAIYEHYLPSYYGDELPETIIGQVVAIADKVDTVTGYFLAGLEPTGSEDPYSLRRQAQGVCLIILSLEKNLSLDNVLLKSLELYANIPGLLPQEEAYERLKEFYRARFLRILADRGFENSFALTVLDQLFVSPLDALDRLSALKKFAEEKRKAFENLLTAYQRVRNLSKPELGTEYDLSYLEEPEEKALASAVETVASEIKSSSSEEILTLFAELKGPIDSFFDSVLVMHEDERVRENRLRLLNRTLSLFHSYADFSSLI
jgi:glycyl-tRNA synthetase beta chain